jgi:hypothetical protein
MDVLDVNPDTMTVQKVLPHPVPGSITFIVYSRHVIDASNIVVRTVLDAARADDEVIILTGDALPDSPPIDSVSIDPAQCGAVSKGPALSPRTIVINGASSFRLRALIPTIGRNEWTLLLEDHGVMPPDAITAMRDLIDAPNTFDLVAARPENLTSVSHWGWANFLHTLCLAWVSPNEPPPFVTVTNVMVRTASLGGRMLRDGEFELRLIPRLFAQGRLGFSPRIWFDHVNSLNFVSCLRAIFHNARAGAAVQRDLGVDVRTLLHEARLNMIPRPQMLVRALEARAKDVPRGMAWRLQLLGTVHMLGHLCGVLFGGGRAAYKFG